MEISLRTKNCSNFQEKILVGVTLKLRFSDLAIDDENENVRMMMWMMVWSVDRVGDNVQ